MGHPRIVELRDQFVVDISEVDPRNFGTDRPGNRFDLDSVVVLHRRAHDLHRRPPLRSETEFVYPSFSHRAYFAAMIDVETPRPITTRTTGTEHR
jgi:hypothetical protein